MRDPRLDDKWYRLTHLYKIKDKDGNLVTFKPRGPQLRHYAEAASRKRKRILKYRQGGFTTLYCIDYLDDALFVPGFSAAIIAHERETLDRIFGIIKRAYENLDPALRPKTNQDTLRSYKFEKAYDGTPLDSEIYVAMKLRGGTVQALHISERAYITGERSQELEAGSKQAVPLTGRISEETTANGMGEFYRAFMKSRQNPNPGTLDYMSYFYAWHQEKDYTLPGSLDEYLPYELKMVEMVEKEYGKRLTDGQLLWYRWKLDELSNNKEAKVNGLRPEQIMRQEFPSTMLEAFQSGLGNVFDLQKLAELVARQPIRTLQNGTKIWVEPIKAGMEYVDSEGNSQKYIKDREYVLGADPSGGDADDQTVIDIWDKETGEQVAQWAGLIRPDEAAEVARDMGEMYNNAFAGIENNMLSMVLFFSKIYDNFYSVVVIDEKRDRKTKKIGFNTNSGTRDPMIDEFLMRFEQGSITINSELTISQMMSFVKKDNGKREHADGEHDDAVFAAMISIQMMKFFKDKNRTRVFASSPF